MADSLHRRPLALFSSGFKKTDQQQEQVGTPSKSKDDTSSFFSNSSDIDVDRNRKNKMSSWQRRLKSKSKAIFFCSILLISSVLFYENEYESEKNVEQGYEYDNGQWKVRKVLNTFDLADYLKDDVPGLEVSLLMLQAETNANMESLLTLPQPILTSSKKDLPPRLPDDYGSNTFAVMTRRGHKPPLVVGNIGSSTIKETTPNQDRAVVLQVKTSTPFSANKQHQNNLLVGIFDGHGSDGHITSNFIVNSLPDKLGLTSLTYLRDPHRLTPSMSEKMIKECFKKAFIDSNDYINEGKLNTDNMSGSTASLLLRWGQKIYGVNTGDSKTFICSCTSSGSHEVLYQNREDKPNLPGERERIQSAGGIVVGPMSPIDSARVIPRGTTQALAMSRSIGEGKLFSEAGVIPDPTMQVIDLSSISLENDIFAVAVSDGILVGSLNVNQIGRQICSRNAKGSLNLLSLSEQLILYASSQWSAIYRDDISIAIAKIIR